MIHRLEDTNSGAIDNAIVAERHRLGGSAGGMVFTLVIVTDEDNQAEAANAAGYSAGQHPCRILVVIPRPGRGRPRLDAEISMGRIDEPGETVTLRLFGPLASHRESVVLPLLLPDTPVVAWWPVHPPSIPADDEIGKLAERRITDATTAGRPLEALADRVRGYRPGDTDLSWARVTSWRSLLASCLDEPHAAITGGSVSCLASHPSGEVLAAWLRARLNVPIELHRSRGPAITNATLRTEDGDISISRTDGVTAVLRRPHTNRRTVPLRLRSLRDVITEEMHRLDQDEIYEQMLAHITIPPEQNKAQDKANEE